MGVRDDGPHAGESRVEQAGVCDEGSQAGDRLDDPDSVGRGVLGGEGGEEGRYGIQYRLEVTVGVASSKSDLSRSL